ncbi:GNAT family N-acetyltransferase [Liquorilactobacillus satsumensis]|uniref:N-acetyltransferase domain-containing protein n=1 Tax=Liquorilactobacillus satsumensis DSM 16230 = JCM 12392 TaxID=1423801 RepID=A0A0R1V3X7_9LACO|nr:GNAT family N-acetyltransferase [Liquorilactobacillus satsumensis]KRM00257.1 hypothetical protein FD50_GL002234 [Liquorilactobacillus satsumensis DSM 16230 = JCM 12392]MCC7665818.1 N-acetyltransferase [Liquorilactobacillus satsumensis]MCP9313337.1 N-acetyltransferase [Liquorilactobacillus satsumensis]MCP9328168.1 N-acetyltransferase [Liquorilactobacillus satsumensis]MCP9356387.1 N-acetyltransferase [Liquorilactobacillus satsumensis]
MFTAWSESAFDYYRAQTDKNPVAHIGFRLINHEQTYVVEHTWVAEEARGQGLAGRITKDFLDQVAAQKKKVLPLCPFTRAFFEKNPEYKSLLAKER